MELHFGCQILLFYLFSLNIFPYKTQLQYFLSDLLIRKGVLKHKKISKALLLHTTVLFCEGMIILCYGWKNLMFCGIAQDFQFKSGIEGYEKKKEESWKAHLLIFRKYVNMERMENGLINTRGRAVSPGNN